jgi:quercetin dioxygenase-like cupin family protein
MAIPHAKPGEVVDVRPLGPALASAQTKTLVRAEQVEVIRLVVPAGKEIEEHKAKGEIVVHCLEGKVAFTAFGKTQQLEAGALLYLPTGEPHTVKGVEDASLLLTVLLPKH